MDAKSDPKKLAEQLQSGHTEVFPQLMEHYRQLVYNTALYVTRSPEDAEDVTQETFLRVLNKIGQWQGSNFSGWLKCVAKNRAIDLVRRRRILKHSQSPPLFVPEDAIVQQERQSLVNNVLKELPAGQREVVYLRHFQGYSIREIARKRGCAEGTVKATLYQAFQKLRKEFQQLGLFDQ